MGKKVVLAVLIILVIGGAAWYYFTGVHHTMIEKVLSNPTAYAGKTVAIEGEVTDRTAFFVSLKFFKVRDKSGEIIVVTKKSLPEIRSLVSVHGKTDEAFSVGDQKILVFVEESTEETGRKK